MMGNLADYLLSEYYSNVYPKDLGLKRLSIPKEFQSFVGTEVITYLNLARKVVGTQSTDTSYLVKQLHKLALNKHEVPDKQETEVTYPPCEGLLLSEYALQHFGDTHALDLGTPLRAKLNSYLMSKYTTTSLEVLGIETNLVSSTVWSYGVVEGYGYCGVSLLDVEAIPIISNSTVWIFENENTAQRVLTSGLDFPFIIASGRPTRAFHKLVERLVSQNITLYYHGDMDLAGLDMFDNLHKRYPSILAPFMTVQEFKNSQSVSAPKEQSYKLEDSTLFELAHLIKSINRVVYEEQLDLSRCKALII